MRPKNFIIIIIIIIIYYLLSIRRSTKALNTAYNIGLNQVTNYKAGLKQGID